MVISTRRSALYLLCCLACITAVAYLPGCSPVMPPDDGPADGETTQRGKGLIEMTAPAEDLTVVLGDTIELGWSVEGKQTGTIELFYQDQGGQQTLFQTLPVEAQGAVDFDSSVLNFGQTYRFGATLKPDQDQQSADYADGTVTVGSAVLTAVTPSKDIERGLREAFTVEWDGQYLPKGGQCRVVVDFDRRLGSGDELLLGTKEILSSQVSGHYDLAVDTTELEIGRIYNIAVEIFFDGRPVARKFANGKLIVTEETPEGYLTVTQPATDFYLGNDKDDNFLVKWTVGQIIQGDEIRIIARQEATGDEIILAQDLAVASDNLTIRASNLPFGFSYQIVVRVISDGRVTVSVTAPGSVSVILRTVAPGTNRNIGNVNEVTVQWDYSNAPSNSSVKIDFRDRADNSKVIQAASGIALQVSSYSVLTLDLELGHSYDVVTRVMLNDGQVIASAVAPGTYTVLLKAILDPNAESNLARGEPITIGWEIPAESQIDQASSVTILRRDLTMLVEPGNPDANVTTIIEQLSPTKEDNATGNTYVAATDSWALGHSYRMIVRLVSTSQQILVEAWTAIQTGVSMRVLSPAADVEVTQAQQVGVAWQLSAIPDPDASTITIVFRDTADPDDPNPHSVSGISPDQDGVMLAIGSLIVDHIYEIIVELRNSQGQLVVSGTAVGKVTVLEAFVPGATPVIVLDKPTSPYIARGGSSDNVSYTLTNAKGTWLYLFLDPDTNLHNSNELLLYISIAVQPQDNSTGNLVVNANALPSKIQAGQQYNFGGALIDPNTLEIVAYDYADNATLTVPADYQGAYDMTSFIVEKGHRHIGFVSGALKTTLRVTLTTRCPSYCLTTWT